METPVTSRYVVVFDTSDTTVLSDIAPSLLEADGFSTKLYFPRLGIAVVEGRPVGFQTLAAHASERKVPMSLLPETRYYAIGTDSYQDTDNATWGLQAVAAVDSPWTGAGVRMAVLDTGFDAQHPDFAGRTITTASFIDGEGPEDGHGHGTHCIGTACGPRSRANGRGYGIAPGVEIYSGKVLGTDGSGTDSTILSGIDWALQHGCQIISMSLGADVREVHPPYVAAGKRALELGSIIIAAAGNNAARSQGNPGFVGAPANSPYVMAVGAVDSQLQVADFSARAVGGEGGEVDVAGPGVDVYSSWISPGLYRSISGTSMATPHVSGLAALTVEATGKRGQELWDQLITQVRPLSHDPADVGAGLCQAPAAASPTEDVPVVPRRGLEEPAGQSAPLPTTPQSWIVTVDPDHDDDLDQVCQKLESIGAVVTRRMSTLGMIHIQTAARIDKDQLTSIDGVSAVDSDVTHKVNPPEAEVQ